jgi:hypothetical protein
MTIERKLTVPELNEALEKQIVFTGELVREIDRLKFEKATLEVEIARREEAQAELEAVLRAVRALVAR